MAFFAPLILIHLHRSCSMKRGVWLCISIYRLANASRLLKAIHPRFVYRRIKQQLMYQRDIYCNSIDRNVFRLH